VKLEKPATLSLKLEKSAEDLNIKLEVGKIRRRFKH
jgi:hypothetical protein